MNSVKFVLIFILATTYLGTFSASADEPTKILSCTVFPPPFMGGEFLSVFENADGSLVTEEKRKIEVSRGMIFESMTEGGCRLNFTYSNEDSKFNLRLGFRPIDK